MLPITDLFQNPPKLFRGALLDRARLALPRAQRFVFDEEASRIAGKLIGECDDLILRNRQFAIPPYEVTYIEFNSMALVHATGRNHTTSDFGEDQHVGYLFVGNYMYVVVADVNGRMGVSALVYQQRVNENQGTRFLGGIYNQERSEWARLAVLLGSSLEKIDEETRQQILHDVWVHVMIPEHLMKKKSQSMNELAFGSSGDLRNAWTLLLLLHQPSRISYQAMPASGGIRRGRRVAYAAHNIVSIHLGQHETVRKAFHFEKRESPRAHVVKGHFQHWHLSPTCEHDFPFAPDDDDHKWHCRKCHGWRTWVSDYTRGDAGKGFVTKDYEVES